MSFFPTVQLADLLRRRRHTLKAHYAPARFVPTFNARGACFQLLCALPPSAGTKILLPAYHCLAMVDPVVAAGFTPVYYRIRPDLSIDSDDLRHQLDEAVAAVLVVHFFGFPADLVLARELAARHGAFLIEDCAHILPGYPRGTTIGRCGDFALCSYYKYFPSIVGGGIVLNHSEGLRPIDSRGLPWRHHIVLLQRILGQAAKNDATGAFGQTCLFLSRTRTRLRRSYPRRNVAAAPTSTTTPMVEEVYRASSAFLDEIYFFDQDLARTRMPYVVRRLIENASCEHIAERHRANFLLLDQALPESDWIHSPWRNLAADVVPLMFPFRLKDRSKHENALRALGIPLMTFGERLHATFRPGNEETRRDTEILSNELCILPIDQQTDRVQIEEMASTLLAYLETKERPDETGPRNRADGPRFPLRF